MPDEELEAPAGIASSRSRAYDDDSPLDARILALDDEAESPFLRGQKRVPVRRGPIPRKAASRLKIALMVLVAAGVTALVWTTLYQYLTRSWRFQIDSSDNVAVAGNANVSRAQVMDIMAADIGRNVFHVPLDVRQSQLQQISWVKSATVMRLLPDRLRIVVKERTPVAFVAINSRIELIDAAGVILEPPASGLGSYSFPVIVGMSDTEPLSTRAARMKMYVRLIRELDANGAHYSRDISDVDLSDPDDVKATVTDPHGAVLVHLGTENFLERFQRYVAHVQEWRTQFPNMKSVSLRFEHQVVIDPEAGAGTPTASNEASPPEELKPPAPPNSKPAVHRSRKHR